MKDCVEKVAEAVLYEGYLLYPYRRSALKNQMRWTFGGVHPRRHSEATGGDDPWLMQTQCLVAGSSDARVEVKVRFLQVVDRSIWENTGGVARRVESLRVDGRVYRPWDEFVEREVVSVCRVGDLSVLPYRAPIAIAEGISREDLTEASGRDAGAIVREWQAISGEIEIAAQPIVESLFRLTVKIINNTPFTALDRSAVVRRSLISTHTILRVSGGGFVSLLEPPDEFQDAAKECENIHTWPVLAGNPGDCHTLLSSPIILYDYPQVSPESPGDLFDGTEIDELLRFSILTLTDEEKEEMRESDERGREILERTEALTPEQLMQLHVSVRRVQAIRGAQP